MNTVARQMLINQLSKHVQQNPDVFKKLDAGSKGYLSLGEFMGLVRQVSNATPEVALDTFRELESKFKKVGLEAITGCQVQVAPPNRSNQPAQPPQVIMAKAAEQLARQGKTIRDVFQKYDADNSNLWGQSELEQFLKDYAGNIQPDELEQVMNVLNKYRIQPFEISAYTIQQFFTAPSQPSQPTPPQPTPPTAVGDNYKPQSAQAPQQQQRSEISQTPQRQPNQKIAGESRVPEELKQWLPLLSPKLAGEEPYNLDNKTPGLKEFIDIFSQLKQQGGKFSDIEFAPSNLSQGQLESNKVYKWDRPQQFFKDHFDVFEQSQGSDRTGLGAFVDPDDIQQGALGDCYFLSTLSSISYLYPEAIVNLFITRKVNDYGIYSVQLCLEGVWRIVTIDDQFPVQDGRPAFTRSDAKELWVMILEKAWAKAYKSYANIEAGQGKEVMRAILGCPTLSVRTDDKDFDSKIEQYCSKNYVMVSGTRATLTEQDEKILGLVKGHAYSLLNLVSLKHPQIGDVKLIQLRNPWGQTEWTGDWSDSSSLWTPTLKDTVNMKEKNDGDFFMDIRDFKKQFTSVDVGFYHPGFRYSSFQVQSNKKKGLYYKFEIVKEGEYYISAVQDSERHFRGQYKEYKYSPIRSLLAKIDGDKYQLIGASNTADRESWVGGKLTPGQYILHVKASWTLWSDYPLVVSSYGVDNVNFTKTEKSPDMFTKIFTQVAQTTPPKTYYSSDEGKIEFVEVYDMASGFGYFVIYNSLKSATASLTAKYAEMTGIKLRKPYRGGGFTADVKPGTNICVVYTVSPTGTKSSRSLAGQLKK